MLSAVFSGLTTKAAIGAGLIGALIAVVPAGLAAHTLGYGKATKEFRKDRDAALARENVALKREISLWHELTASRLIHVELIARVEAAWNVSDEAREKVRVELGRYKAQASSNAKSALDAIARLKEIENGWKTQTVPRDVLEPFCLRVGARNCDPATPAAAGADAGDAVAVRQPAAGDGGQVDK
ncbi:MAG: hypothetical protein C0421_03915 [Hyphomonas sp.]|uniref:hypothetical protein n=1 Tax=Hyphomonas sp. TaxID=87 RepID=UPI0025C4F4EB|nr:hypothetical protein [Hyphomonas sp.]MBA4337973.1 hypothetical protein [Hyphomonas sp.]